MLNNTEINHLLQNCNSHTERCLLLLLLSTGARIGALSRLTYGDVKEEEDASFPATATIIEKGNRPRCIPITSDVLRVIKMKAVSQRCQDLPEDDAWLHAVSERLCIFRSARNPMIPMNVRCLRQIFYTLCDRAGIGRPIWPHLIRHTVAHQLWRCGNPVVSIAKFLGHKSVHTTFTQYLDLSTAELIMNMNIPWLHDMKDFTKSTVPIELSTSPCSVQIPMQLTIHDNPVDHSLAADKRCRLSLKVFQHITSYSHINAFTAIHHI